MGIFIEPEFTEYYRKNPIVLVDIGASGGLEPNWQLAKNYLQIIGFEPDVREFFNLEKEANREGKNISFFSRICGRSEVQVAYPTYDIKLSQYISRF